MKLEDEVKDKDNVKKNITLSASNKIKELEQQISKLTAQLLNISKL